MQGQRKIPTIVGIILVIAIMAGIGFLFEFLSKGQTRASSSLEPQKVTVTNVSDTGFTIVWQTQDPASGNMTVLGPNGKKYSAFDERDTTGKLGKYITHSVSIRSLIPETAYDVTILSNGKRYPVDKKSYQVTTYPLLASAPVGLDPAYGKVTTPEGVPADGAILFLTLTGGQTVSTLVRNSGSWIIPLTTIRTADGVSYLPVSERVTETILVEKSGVESQVITDTLNDAPVPDITLGETYDFRNRDAKKPTQANLAAAPASNAANAKTAVLGVETSKTTSGSIALTAPAEGASISTTRPQIRGLGIAGKKVTIMLGVVNPSVGSITVGTDGLWKYTPTTPLAYGKQSVTITTVDMKNKPVVITHAFTVLKSGTQVLGDATPSAILETPTPEPTTEASTISAEPMPTSGSLLPTLLLLILGSALFIGGGSVLFVR
ncbi:MAG: hypothetical protein V1917_01715 [Candidatus Gottesmanbacteria bacterium]